jgi:nickel-type superoxide dismutase maturation protease
MRWPLWRVAVAERSMEPALHPGDWLVVRRTIVPGRPLRLRPGQIVVARHPGRPDLLIVKRATRRQDGGWWLASDNPFAAGAADSARFGPVPLENIVAVVLVRYWPLRRSRPRREPDLSGTGAADCLRVPVLRISAVAPRAARPSPRPAG